jgi:hypothetical protein
VETKSQGSGGWFHRPTLTADGKRLAIHYLDFELFLYDTATWKVLAVQNFAGRAVSPDGKWVAGTLLDRLALYEPESGKRLSEVTLGRGTVLSLTILPDSRRVLTSGPGGVAHLWDVSKQLDK